MRFGSVVFGNLPIVFAALGTFDFPDPSSGYTCLSFIGSPYSGTFTQRTVARALDDFHFHCPGKIYQVTTGNNYPPSGISSNSSDLFDHWVDYHLRAPKGLATAKGRGSLHFPTLGPIDYLNGVDGINALKHPTNHFSNYRFPEGYRPETYYAFTIQLRNGRTPTVKIVMIDTVRFSTTQQEWLEHELAVTDTDYLLVIGAYPVVSTGPFGDTMVNTSLPQLLETYEVTAYISGNDRSLQHLVHDNVNYFVSGTTGVSPTTTSYRRGTTRYHSPINGFLGCYANSANSFMTCDLRDCDNNVLHSVNLPQRTKAFLVSSEIPQQCFPDQVIISSDDNTALETALNTAGYVGEHTEVIVV